MSCDRQHQNTFITLLFGSDRQIRRRYIIWHISYACVQNGLDGARERERERERERGIERDIHVSAVSHTSHVSLSGMDKYIG